MRKWKVLGRIFEGIGIDLMYECENMETNCETDEAFDRTYALYAMMLDTLKAQRHFISVIFDEIVAESEQ